MDLNRFAERLFPTKGLLWSSSNGTAIRVEDDKGRVSYRAKPIVKVKKHKPTEAEDNAAGRRIRRRTNKALRGWLPYAQR